MLPTWGKKLIDRAIDEGSGLMFRGIGGAAVSSLLATIITHRFVEPYLKVMEWTDVALGVYSLCCIAVGVSLGNRNDKTLAGKKATKLGK